MRSTRSRCRDEAGQVGGIEAIVFGLLILVVGVLLVSNAWGVIDAKMAAREAAREAVRAFVTAPATDEIGAEQIAHQAALDTLNEMGWTNPSIVITKTQGAFERCAVVTYEVRIPVPAFTLPWLSSGVTTFEANAYQSERVDPYRSGVPADPDGPTVCDGQDQIPAGP